MAQRRRVIISAYAFGPVDEPEAAAAWAFATAAAVNHDVWVITRKRFHQPVNAVLSAAPGLASNLHVEFIDYSERLMSLRRRLPGGLYWYYPLWQNLLLKKARQLHAQHDFHVAHHVTFANDWLPCGLSKLEGVPFVWGPVGGASHLPYWQLRKWLGARGLASELIRDVVTRVPRRLFGDSAARGASVVVAQNSDVAERFSFARRVVIEPNAALDKLPIKRSMPQDGRAERRAVSVGRLIPLKGVSLSISAIARPEAAHWSLDIFGEGHQRTALERLANRLGVADRVRFFGHRPRSEVLESIASADAMLFPSMHDQAGWAGAEASSLGCPVVCLPLGGPPLLAGPNAFIASLEGDLVSNLVEQLNAAGESGGIPHDLWSSRRMLGLVDDWYRVVLSERRGVHPQ